MLSSTTKADISISSAEVWLAKRGGGGGMIKEISLSIIGEGVKMFAQKSSQPRARQLRVSWLTHVLLA